MPPGVGIDLIAFLAVIWFELEEMIMVSRTVIDRTEDPRPGVRRRGTSPDRGHGGGGPLERLTVNLIARASRALQQVSDLNGDSKTDSVNRALQIYAYLEQVRANGGDIYVRETKDSELMLVKMF